MKTGAGSRRKSREIALSLLYSIEFAGKEGLDSRKEETLGLIEKEDADDEYASCLFDGVSRCLDSIDEAIRGASLHWRLERMSLIDRNIIRIGVFEILELKVPVEIAINEAVDLARTFGDEKSGAFVNGILDAVARKLGDQA